MSCDRQDWKGVSQVPSVTKHGGDWVPPGMDYGLYRRQGMQFAMRYVVPSIAGKCVTLPEIKDAHAAGVDIGFVYETTGTTWNGGYDAGLADAFTASSVLGRLGVPKTCAVYHAVDVQVGQQVMSTVMEWVRGLLDGMRPYRAGVYGQYLVVASAGALYPHVLTWQTKAWSGASIYPRTDLLQLGTSRMSGIDIDIDIAYVPFFGQWTADPANQPPALNGEDMISGTLDPIDTQGRPFPAGSATTVAVFADTGLMAGAAQKVRVALYSDTHGWSQIVDVDLQHAVPYVIKFAEHDVSAVSFSRKTGDGSETIGFSIS